MTRSHGAQNPRRTIVSLTAAKAASLMPGLVDGLRIVVDLVFFEDNGMVATIRLAC
jgi:hypothetical protein